MVKVSVEVREEATLFRVAVRADSISRAVSVMKGRHPGSDVRVVFPIDPEGFFGGGPNKTEGDGGSRVRLLPERVR